MTMDNQQDKELETTEAPSEEKECVGLECYFDKHPEEKPQKERREYDGVALDPANVAARQGYGLAFRDPYDSPDERLSGQALDRYYYWGDGTVPPQMRQTPGRYMRPQSQYRPLHVDDYETQVSVPVRYDYVTNQYDSEYGDVSDLYAAYMENRDVNEYRRHRGVSMPRLRRDVFRPQEAPKRREDTFTFSEKVLEKIAAQAVRDVDGVLAMAGDVSNSIFERFTQQSTKAEVVDEGVRLDLRVVLAYGVNGKEVFKKVVDNITEQIQSMTDLTVDAIHIEVVDIMDRDEFNAQYQSQAPDVQAAQRAARDAAE